MTVYSNFIATANRLVGKYGTAMSHISRAPAAYDASTGSSVVTETTQSIKGLFDTSNGQKNVPPGADTRINQQLLIAPAGVVIAIKPGDDILVGSTRYTVVSANQVNPSGEIVLWQVTVSSGA